MKRHKPNEAMAQMYHVPALDGCRAMMVFMVSWYHIWQQSWLSPTLTIGTLRISFEPYVRAGYVMVDGMILLSGFVLFLPYARHMLMDEPLPEIKGFYKRRLSRIVPSYVFMLAVMLFAVAIPQQKYASAGAMWQDILMHLTFTHTFTRATYLYTPLNMAAWTIGIEMQAYLIFPYLARGMVKKPVVTFLGMVGAGFAYRAICIFTLDEYAMVVNQMPSFLDVFALGMLGAYIYIWAVPRLQKHGWVRWVLTGLTVVFMIAVGFIIRTQASVSGYALIQQGQMIRRFPLTFCLLGAILCLCLGVKGIRLLLGNRVTRFLAGISLNYYLWHQTLAVWLKNWHIPPYESETPQMAGEQPWQTQYTYLCFALAVLSATAVTYLIERPGAKGIKKLFTKTQKRSVTL